MNTPNVLLITFSLRDQLKDYEPFFVTVRGNALQWCHYIEQTLLISTPYSVDEIYHKLKMHIGRYDSLLILPVPDAKILAGQLPQEAWDWLHRVSADRRAELSAKIATPRSLPGL